MTTDDPRAGRGPDVWAQLRFAVVGPLLAAPPGKGALQAALQALADKTWMHPIRREPVRFGFSTIEAWYYRVKAETDPVGRLRRQVRKDAGLQPSLGAKLRPLLFAQHRDHPSWSVQLHYDNLTAVARKDATLEAVPSYTTVRRYMKANGLVRRRRRRGGPLRPGEVRAAERLERREVRSYEAEYVYGLWHADFHVASRPVLCADGKYHVPLLLGVLDDRSRLCCHAQWYLNEDPEHYVHGICQAFQKRGLPRALLSDNGGAMTCAETVQGLTDLSVVAQTTLAESPYQNAKQEVFWAQVEGRFLAMLENQRELSLAELNLATQAWVEMEYHRKVHSETAQTPLERFLDGPSVGRDRPSSELLRTAFTRKETRTQRRSDGTISVAGVRFELPNRYRHLEKVTVRLSRWDLSYVLLWDERAAVTLARLFPLDKTRNAEGKRAPLEPIGDAAPADGPRTQGVAPLLQQYLDEYTATGLPPAYLPKDDSAKKENP